MTADRIIEEAVRRTGIRERAIRSRERFPTTVRARQLVMAAMRESGYSYPEIARELGHNHHSGAMLGARKGAPLLFDLRLIEPEAFR